MDHAHDINGASVLYRRHRCPGSAREEVDMPDTPSAAAERGDRLHDLAHRVQKEGADLLAEVDPEDADAVSFVLERARELQERAGASALLLSEHHVDLAGIGIPLGGTIDVAFVNPGGPAFAQDHKFGRAWVDPPRWNWQARAYAWGLREAFGCTTVTFALAQPAAEDRYRYREHAFLAEDLDQHAGDIRAIVAATKAPDAPLVPGEHCGFCRARATCPARAQVAAEVTVLRDPMATVRAMTPPQRGSFYGRLSVAIEHLAAARSQIEAEAIAGTLELDGYRVGPGKRSRSWADEGVAHAALLRLANDLGKDPSLLIRTAIASPAEAEKILGRGAKDALAEVTTWTDGKPRLTQGKTL
ncbi:MAG: DUF2800 domain-containing protein [Pseudomonadota bacterium]